MLQILFLVIASKSLIKLKRMELEKKRKSEGKLVDSAKPDSGEHEASNTSTEEGEARKEMVTGTQKTSVKAKSLRKRG